MGKKYQQRQGERLMDFRLRCSECEQAEKAKKARDAKNAKARAAHAAKKALTFADRYGASSKTTDIIDGFDRDNLGESPDF